MPIPELLEAREGEAAVVGDARHLPLVLATWWGTATESIVRRYFTWQAAIGMQVADDDARMLLLTDARFARRPPATTRRVIAELSDALPAPVFERSLGSFLVLESAVVRGAFTAMQWISQKEWKVTTVPDLRTGLLRAFSAIESAGLPVPRSIDPETFRGHEMPRIDALASDR